MEYEVKVGDILLAVDPCYMVGEDDPLAVDPCYLEATASLIVGEEYVVHSDENEELYVIDAEGDEHYFSSSGFEECFIHTKTNVKDNKC